MAVTIVLWLWWLLSIFLTMCAIGGLALTGIAVINGQLAIALQTSVVSMLLLIVPAGLIYSKWEYIAKRQYKYLFLVKLSEQRKDEIWKTLTYQSTTHMGLGDWYQIFSRLIGMVTFIGIWIYAFASWGFLIGLAIGWLPALIGGYIAGFLWPLAAILIAALILFAK